MFKRLKISHHSHSCKLRPHEHTSYIPLGVLLLITGLGLLVYTTNATSPGPEAGSVGLTGTMPGTPPKVAAIIKTPVDGQRFSNSPVTLSGSCPANTLVELFKNDIFAGSAPCSESGVFSVEIDLLNGQNLIIARVYDALNQPGPDSNIVTIFYDALPTQADALSTLDFGNAQLLLNTDAVFRGAFPNKEMSIPVEIIGGTPPFAVNIQWGDSNNKVISRNNNVSFNVSHTYQKAGTYQITIQASDALGRVAFLTVASIINGQPDIDASKSVPLTEVNRLLVMWPLYVSGVAILISFWIGEYREKRILIKRGLLVHQ